MKTLERTLSIIDRLLTEKQEADRTIRQMASNDMLAKRSIRDQQDRIDALQAKVETLEAEKAGAV